MGLPDLRRPDKADDRIPGNREIAERIDLRPDRVLYEAVRLHLGAFRLKLKVCVDLRHDLVERAFVLAREEPRQRRARILDERAGLVERVAALLAEVEELDYALEPLVGDAPCVNVDAARRPHLVCAPVHALAGRCRHKV